MPSSASRGCSNLVCGVLVLLIWSVSDALGPRVVWSQYAISPLLTTSECAISTGVAESPSGILYFACSSSGVGITVYSFDPNSQLRPVPWVNSSQCGTPPSIIASPSGQVCAPCFTNDPTYTPDAVCMTQSDSGPVRVTEYTNWSECSSVNALAANATTLFASCIQTSDRVAVSVPLDRPHQVSSLGISYDQCQNPMDIQVTSSGVVFVACASGGTGPLGSGVFMVNGTGGYLVLGPDVCYTPTTMHLVESDLGRKWTLYVSCGKSANSLVSLNSDGQVKGLLSRYDCGGNYYPPTKLYYSSIRRLLYAACQFDLLLAIDSNGLVTYMQNVCTLSGLAVTKTAMYASCLNGPPFPLTGVHLVQCAAGAIPSVVSPNLGFCDLCSGGWYYPSMNDPFGDAKCLECPMGNYSSGGSSWCPPCPAGTFGPEAGLTRCTWCAAGTFSPAVGATQPSTCQPCPRGQYSPYSGAAECYLCAAGTYNPDEGASSSAACLACPDGESSPPGSTSPSDCKPVKLTS